MAFITPGQVSNIPKKPLTPPTEWTRPGDWPTITDDANKIQMLVSDIGTQSSATYSTYTINTVFTRVTGGHNVFIDWGDGTPIETVTTTTSTNTSHNYTTGGATCSRGYKTWIITITKDTTVSITTCNLVAPVNLSSPLYFSSGLLELYHGDNIASAVGLNNKYGNANTITGNYPYLEYVKLPSTWTGTSLAYAFYGCINLQRVIMPVTMNSCTSMGFCFQNCSSLQTITFPSSMTACTTLGNAFAACSSLYQITFPSGLTLNSITDMNNTFLDCEALDNVTLPSLTGCTSYSATFQRCVSLTNVKLTAIATGIVTITWTNAFNTCSSLVRADIPLTGSTSTTWACSGMFNGCGSLAYFSFPSSLAFSNLNNTFLSCDNLVRVDMPTTLSAGSSFTMASCFSGCSNLAYMTLPTGGSPSCTSLASAFNGCASLTSVTITWSLTSCTDMSSAFNNCYNLKTISLTAAAANSITTMATAFQNCYLLTSLTLPTSLTGVTTLASAFNNCYNLTTITFPSTMSALTNMSSTFANCRELVNLTLPTTISTSASTFASCFSGCWNLNSVTLPTTGTNVSNLSSAFADTYAMRTINFNSANSFSNGPTIASMLIRSSVNTLLNTAAIGGTAATQPGAVNAATLGNYAPFCATYSMTARLTAIDISGTSTSANAYVKSLRLLYSTSTGQWTGSSPQINVSYTGITYTNLVQLFNDMAAQGTVTSKTINITACTGASSLTAADRLIVTSKGWTITG